MQIRRLALLSVLILGAVWPLPQTWAAAPRAERRPTAIRSAEGAVLAVDAAAKSLTIRGQHGDMVFVWDDATAVVGRKTPAYLKAGSSITVQYTTSAGVKRASKIIVNPPKRAVEQG